MVRRRRVAELIPVTRHPIFNATRSTVQDRSPLADARDRQHGTAILSLVWEEAAEEIGLCWGQRARRHMQDGWKQRVGGCGIRSDDEGSRGNPLLTGVGRHAGDLPLPRPTINQKGKVIIEIVVVIRGHVQIELIDPARTGYAGA